MHLVVAERGSKAPGSKYLPRKRSSGGASSIPSMILHHLPCPNSTGGGGGSSSTPSSTNVTSTTLQTRAGRASSVPQTALARIDSGATIDLNGTRTGGTLNFSGGAGVGGELHQQPHLPPATSGPLTTTAPVDLNHSSLPDSLKTNFAVRYYKVIENSSEVYDIVTRALNRRKSEQWEELPPTAQGPGSNFLWNLLWTWSNPKIDYSRLLVWQKVNHFPENKHLTRKDRLKRNIERYTKHSNQAVGCQFRVMPQTFILPKEYLNFCQVYAAIEEREREETKKRENAEEAERERVAQQRADKGTRTPGEGEEGSREGGGEGGPTGAATTTASAPPTAAATAAGPPTTDGGKNVPSRRPLLPRKNYWIMKPAKSSRGRGIYLLSDIGEVSYGELSIICGHSEQVNSGVGTELVDGARLALGRGGL